MVSIVLVAHSAELAEGARRLAEQVAGGRVRLAAAGGLSGAVGVLGTDATRVADAIRVVDDPDGVLVLVDLGSALLSAETAIELLPLDVRARVRISPAALVEGAVAAAAAAAAGSALAAVEAEARRALLAKEHHLGITIPSDAAGGTASPESPALVEEVVIPNALGIHARPAGLVVAAAARHNASVTLSNLSRDTPHALACSLTQVAMLDARQGDRIAIQASGPQAASALREVADLLRSGFGEPREGELPAPSTVPTAEGGRLTGLPGSPGIVCGPAVLLSSLSPRVAQRTPEPADRELARLAEGLRRAREETRTLAARMAATVDREADIFTAQLQLLDDPELVTSARARIAEGGMTAELAWQEASEEVARRFQAMRSPLLAARSSDVRDVARRVSDALSGGPHAGLAPDQAAILIAPEFLPSEVALFDRGRTLGLAAAYGAPHGHACILARAIGLPMVVGLGAALLALPPGKVIALDGARGTVFLDLTAEQRARLEAQAAAEQMALEAARAACHAPATTADGQTVEVVANIGRLDEIDHATRLGAEGVGVLRTEFLFLERTSPPSEAEQEETYRKVLRAMNGSRVIVRTLDLGGDKPVPYLPALFEANPYLGERGLRRSLRHPELFLAQARALWRAGPAGRLHILLPMVTTREEIRRARDLLDQARRESGALSDASPVPLGIMVETPAAALMIEHLLPEVDFVSVGTNDLTQYTLAAERGNENVAGLYDACHPAVLRLISRVVDATHRSGKWAGVCGEVAADPQAIPILVGLGVDELSMAPGAIPGAKQHIRQLRFSDARRLAEIALGCGTADEVRALTRQRSATTDT